MPNIHGNAAERKDQPIFSGVIRYFPRALAALAHLSKVGNEQHNPGKPLHWDRSKSGDELDALTRHLVDAGSRDTDGEWHDTKVAWRALANLEKLLEQQAEAQANVERPLPVGWYERTSGMIGPWSSNGPVEATHDPEKAPSKPVASVDLHDEASPFIPVTFTRPPRTEDFPPEYEDASNDDGHAVSDAVARVDEIEPHADEDHDPPVAPEYGVVMVRKTSEDQPVVRTFKVPRIEAGYLDRIDTAVQKYGR